MIRKVLFFGGVQVLVVGGIILNITPFAIGVLVLGVALLFAGSALALGAAFPEHPWMRWFSRKVE